LISSVPQGLIAVGLNTHQRWLVLALLKRISKGIANARAEPAIENLHQLLHGTPLRGVIPSSTGHKKAETGKNTGFRQGSLWSFVEADQRRRRRC
jgi:hypothetical protein